MYPSVVLLKKVKLNTPPLIIIEDPFVIIVLFSLLDEEGPDIKSIISWLQF